MQESGSLPRLYSNASLSASAPEHSDGSPSSSPEPSDHLDNIQAVAYQKGWVWHILSLSVQHIMLCSPKFCWIKFPQKPCKIKRDFHIYSFTNQVYIESWTSEWQNILGCTCEFCRNFCPLGLYSIYISELNGIHTCIHYRMDTGLQYNLANLKQREKECVAKCRSLSST